ncbi:MAG TPA: DNA starvation/stationary phase protection protein [Blastocatellia bacterium]|nr:DNA starvation/stationary phase protection protein [Blastocatellia bacterium]
MANSSMNRTGARMAEPAKTQATKANGRIKSYPAPKELATPTDLKPEEVRSIVEAVNPIIADAFALFTKTKNYHWHIASSHFRDYHLLLDEQADSIMDSVDPLAERVRRIGGTTIRSLAHISQLQSIADDNHDFVPPDKMIQELIKDNRQLAERQRAAIDICEDNRDSATSNTLQEILNETEKRIWFLYEISTGGRNEY